GFLPEERAWIDKLIQHGFVDTFRRFNDKPEQYTWWDMKTRARERNIGWRLDYFFVSQELIDRVAGAFILNNVREIIGSDGSDHCPVGIKVVFH
ncbi:MAG TPA: exodeoxyribonuclease III, partial [Dehalococcoidia bacterium]|nr:exodeoxyribonuclease III [Dehalococcoidia bacterium]